MASLNKVMLIGNAGKDADLRYSANGTAMATFSLAVNNRRRGQSGELEDQTDWFNIVLFAETAERVSQYVTKGKSVFVEGRLTTRTYDNAEGVKQYRTEVIANNIQLLGSRDSDGGGDSSGGGGWNDQPDRQVRPAGGQARGGQSRGAFGGGNTGGAPRQGNGPVDDIDDLPLRIGAGPCTSPAGHAAGIHPGAHRAHEPNGKEP